ncbi:MAG: CotS family spore coat protein [Bacteroidota bacterium]
MGHTAPTADRFLDTLQDYMTLQQVAKEFGLRMRGYRKQGNACIVETDEGAKEVRRLRHSLAEYRFACAATEFLRGQGFSRLPRATWAPSGCPIVSVNGANYTMREWVPGTQVDLDNLCQLTQAVEMLAWFHRCSQGFNTAETPAVRGDWGSLPRRMAARIEESYGLEDKARNGGEEDRFARHFLKVFDSFVGEAAHALEELEASPYERLVALERERGGLCHRDYTANNLVLRDDGALYLADFDDITMDTRLEDLGKFIGRHGGWELERTLFILQVYHGVNPITRSDVMVLLAYLRFPFDFWSLAGAHFAGKATDRHALKKLAEMLPVKLRFLDQLRRADLSFLEGAGFLYNLGFINLPEVPAGKAWSASAWSGADGPVATEADWHWQTTAVEPLAIPPHEPVRETELYGTVLEETAGGMGIIWPDTTEGAVPSYQYEPNALADAGRPGGPESLGLGLVSLASPGPSGGESMPAPSGEPIASASTTAVAEPEIQVEEAAAEPDGQVEEAAAEPDGQVEEAAAEPDVLAEESPADPEARAGKARAPESAALLPLAAPAGEVSQVLSWRPFPPPLRARVQGGGGRG